MLVGIGLVALSRFAPFLARTKMRVRTAPIKERNLRAKLDTVNEIRKLVTFMKRVKIMEKRDRTQATEGRNEEEGRREKYGVSREDGEVIIRQPNPEDTNQRPPEDTPFFSFTLRLPQSPPRSTSLYVQSFPTVGF